jgi:hypothetical protein
VAVRGALIVVALVIAVATALGASVPANGEYEGTANGIPAPGGHNEGEGLFRVRSGARGKSIVPSPRAGTIRAPTDFICKQGNPTASNILQTKRIPIRNGAFDYTGVPTGVAGRHIRFKGHWTSATHLVGFTRTTGGGCNHTIYWKMHKTGP